MLHGMGHAWHVVCIAEAAYVYIDSCAGFVGVWIVNKESFKLVR